MSGAMTFDIDGFCQTLVPVGRFDKKGMVSLAGSNVDDKKLKELAEGYYDRLRALNLSCCMNFSDSGLDLVLTRFPRLWALKLEWTPIADESIKNLAQCLQLEWLDLSRDQMITDEGMKYMAKCLKLRRLSLFTARVTDTGVGRLFDALSNLEELNLDETKVTDKSIRLASKCLKLRRIGLSNAVVSDDSIVPLAESCHLLQTLFLWRAKITNKSVKALVDNCPDLRQLGLEKTGVTDEGIKLLSKLLKLEQLNLDGLPVTDDAVQELAKCQQLEILGLMGTNITDKALAILAECPRQCPKLNKLLVWKTQVTDAGVDLLRKKRPGITIGYSHGGIDLKVGSLEWKEFLQAGYV